MSDAWSGVKRRSLLTYLRGHAGSGLAFCKRRGHIPVGLNDDHLSLGQPPQLSGLRCFTLPASLTVRDYVDWLLWRFLARTCHLLRKDLRTYPASGQMWGTCEAHMGR